MSGPGERRELGRRVCWARRGGGRLGLRGRGWAGLVWGFGAGLWVGSSFLFYFFFPNSNQTNTIRIQIQI